MEPLSTLYTPFLVLKNGGVVWNMMGIYKTSCSMDSTYYPMDSQTCSIVVTTWGMTEDEVKR